MDRPDAQGWTALHVASFMNRPEATSKLLAAGVDIDAVTYGSELTALHLACSKGHIGIVKLLTCATTSSNERGASAAVNSSTHSSLYLALSTCCSAKLGYPLSVLPLLVVYHRHDKGGNVASNSVSINTEC